MRLTRLAFEITGSVASAPLFAGALVVLCGLTALLSARGYQRTDSTFTPSSEGPAIVKSVAPVYPAIAQSARVSGVVVIEFAVDVAGLVIDARIIRGPDLLTNTAMDAVRQWQFTPPAALTRMRATATFQLNIPSLYPRPSRFAQPHPSWVPDNFAFTYKFECRGGVDVEIDSIDRLVKTFRHPGPRASEFAFSFEGDIVADVFTAVDRGGVINAPADRSRSWREIARVESDLHQHGNEVFVTVAQDVPPVVVVTLHFDSTPGHLLGNSPSSQRFPHALAVRRGDRWTELRWSEPVEKGDDLTRGFAAAGKRIRALVRDGLVPAAAAPVCL